MESHEGAQVASNSQSSCLCLARSRITGVNNHGHVQTLECDLHSQYKGSLYKYTPAV